MGFRVHLCLLPTLLTGLIVGCSLPEGNHHRARPRPLASEFAVFHPPDPGETRSPPAPQNPTGPLRFEAALALALRQNPELRARAWKERAGAGSLLQAGLFPNPELELEAEEFAGTGELREFEAAELSIGLSQLIELGGKRTSRQQLAGLEQDVAAWELEAERLRVWESTAHSFIDVLAQQRRLQLAELSLALSETVLEVAARRVAAGKVPPLERMRAEVDVATQSLAIDQERSAWRRARLALAANWGGTEALFDGALEGRFDTLTVVLPELPALQQLLEHNPELKSWEAQIAQQRAQLGLEEALAVPDLTVGFGLSYFRESDDVALHAGVSIPLPFFDRNQGSIMQAQAALLQAEEERHAAALRLYRSLQDAYLELQARTLEVQTLQQTLLPAAERAFALAQTGYVDGKFSYLEVLDAERTLFEAQARAVDAYQGYHTALVSCEALVGTSLRANEPGVPDHD